MQKNDFIFATYNKSIIKIWSIENSNNYNIKISFQGEIDTKFNETIKQMIIL